MDCFIREYGVPLPTAISGGVRVLARAKVRKPYLTEASCTGGMLLCIVFAMPIQYPIVRGGKTYFSFYI
jgi:hypothetical protein